MGAPAAPLNGWGGENLVFYHPIKSAGDMVTVECCVFKRKSDPSACPALDCTGITAEVVDTWSDRLNVDSCYVSVRDGGVIAAWVTSEN